MEQPSYYSILTANVRYDPRLKHYADCKVLYSEITALSNKNGYCHATNKYFAKLYDRPVPTISKWINLLKDCGYLKIKMIRDGKQIKERRIFPISTPINADVNTYSREHDGGINANVKGGINVDVKENNTSINNTSINRDDDDPPTEDAFNLAQLVGINVNSGLNLPIFTDYIKRLGNDLVCYAIKRTNELASHPNWSYLKTVLKSLEDNHVKTIEQAEVLSKKYGKQRYKGSKQKTKSTPAYQLPTKDEGMTQAEALAKELAKEEEEDRKKSGDS